MSAPATSPSPAARPLPTPSFTFEDKAMVGLALASAVLVLGDILFRQRLVQWEVFAWVVWVDLAITAVFLVEFFTSASKFGSLLGYAKANWYEVVGMVPMAAFVWLEVAAVPGGTWSHMLANGVPAPGAAASGAAGAAGALRLFRLLRIVRIFVAGSRLMRASNVTFGEQVVQRLLGRYINIIVDLLATPILVVALSQMQRTAARGRYAESIGKALDAKRPEIHKMVMDSLERARLDKAAALPPIEAVIRRVEEEVVTAVVETLTSEELNKIVQDTTWQLLEDFKNQVKSGEFRTAEAMAPPVPTPPK